MRQRCLLVFALLALPACNTCEFLSGGAGLPCLNDEACPPSMFCLSSWCTPIECTSDEDCGTLDMSCQRHLCTWPDVDAGELDGSSDVAATDGSADRHLTDAPIDDVGATDHAPGFDFFPWRDLGTIER